MIDKLFIDAGSFDGRTARLFRKRYGPTWTIHCFEPDARIENEESNVILHREAVWIHDGEIDLHLGNPQSSTLIAGKTSGGVGTLGTVRVPCIDFARWLCEHADATETVVVKLNIEGAEYAVLRHLLDTGMIRLVDKLLVEWHVSKLPMTKGEHREVEQAVRDSGVKLRSIWGTRWLE